MKKEKFEVGDVVKFKEGLRNRRLPDNQSSAIVIEVLDTPIANTEESSGSNGFNEPLDVKCSIEIDGHLEMFYYDSARLTKIAHIDLSQQ